MLVLLIVLLVVILLVAVLAGGWFGRGPAGPTGPTVIRRVVRRPVRTVVEEPATSRRTVSRDDVV